MSNDTESRRRRWGVGTAVLVAAAGGLLFLIFSGLPEDSVRPQEEESSIQGPAVVSFIVDGMTKSKSGAT